MGTQAIQESHLEAFSYLSVLQCPHCGSSSLIENEPQTSIDCQSCQTSFPELSFGDVKLPFLFAEADIAAFDWCARINGFNRKVAEEIESLTTGLKSKTISKNTRDRLKRLLQAKKHYQTQLLTHLECFQKYQASDSLVMHTELAKNQGIDSYINNIFRDWCWNNGENEELLHAINNVIDENFTAGVCLTLGAGASRLSYDFHHTYNADHSVLIDINPVLLGYAAKILNNQPVVLNEFPIAPIASKDYAVEQTCQHEDLLNLDEFTLLLADGLNAPFESKSFDTVVTPWFIDIIPTDLKEFIPHVNRLLKVGGTWVNSGSLAFFHANPQWNYSEEEVIDLLKKYGFADIKVNRTTVNYLHSPHSAHGRVENVFSFSAIKKFDSVSAKKNDYLPSWIENPSHAIPKQDELVAASSKYLLQAQVLSAIDGQRSIVEIGGLLAKQYGMPEHEAVAAVRKILIDNLSV